MILGESNSLIAAIPPETVPLFILLVSIVGFTIIIERMIFFSRWKSFKASDISRLKELLREKSWDRAVDFLRSLNSGPVSTVLQTGIEFKRRGETDPEGEMQTVGYEQINRMERFLTGLGTIATISPLLGVLGTVLGIIRSFAAGSGSRAAEVGISEALITTAMGLSVAIPAYIFYNYFNRKKEDTITEMENISEQALKLLKES